MFGRSGQMFPRRTFHDAIYEEEYGSDNEDECCRCRGLSAILCWFLSVIILVGLAATVVLTVFFILRSRTLMVKPDVDLDVEMYGKDQNLFESNAGGGASKELLGSNESPIAVNESGGGGNSKGKKGTGRKSNGRGPPDSTNNDVDSDVNEDQNAINDSSEDDQAEDASMSHSRNHPNHHHTNDGRRNRLQAYPTKTTTVAPTTEAPTAEVSEEEHESSSEEEPEQNNGEGSSLFNLFSGPRNPSYNTPNQHEDGEGEEPEEDDGGAVISAESSADYKSTRYNDGSPVQQVLFTESPTVTTPNPYNNRRNLQTTRFPTGRTSFSSTTTTVMPPPAQEESEEEEEEEDDHNHEDGDDQHNEDHNDEDGGDDENSLHHENDETSREDENGDDESNKDNEKSSEEDTNKLGLPASSPSQTTTSVYGKTALSGESEIGNDGGDSQLKQMLLDSIPPHGEHKDDHDDMDSHEEMVSSSEFHLTKRPYITTTTAKPKTTKPSKTRQDTLTRLISRNFTRISSNAEEPETSTGAPSVTTMGPAGHRYDYTMTPVERTKLKIKSEESMEQEAVVTKPIPKFRYRSTTSRPFGSSRVPITTVPRTRGTTLPSSSSEYGIKLGDKRGSVESPIDIVPSPDLSRKDSQQQPNSLEGVDLNSASQEDHIKTSSEQQFLDVLVGSEDHKSLVTKKTQDGIVTSAILPPWYDSNGSNSSISDVLATNGTSLSNAVAKVEDDSIVEATSFGEKTTKRKTSGEKQPDNSEFERLVNMFSKQEQSSEEQTPPPPRFGLKKQKPLVLKKPGSAIAGSRYVPSVPGRASLFPSKQDSAKHHSSETKAPSTPSAPSTTASAITGDVGRTGVLPSASDVEAAVATSSYYPDNTGSSDKVVEHHLVESERLSSDEIMDSNEQQPSHVIDVNFEGAANTPAEIIIDQDSSAPMEDEEGDFVEDEDYEGYEESPPMSMSASVPNQKFVPVPTDYVRGSGIRKPVSSEERMDTQASASTPEPTSTVTPSTLAPQVSTSAAPIVIRRPAYTREEILKSSVKPSPGPMTGDNHLDDGTVGQNGPVGSGEGTASDEFEEYEDENYEGGSMEQAQTGSVEQWSNEKGDHRWSAPDKIRDQTEVVAPEHYASDEIVEENEPEETVLHANLQNRLDSTPPSPSRVPETLKANSSFQPPQPVSFHENKLSFSAPQNEGQYHSKDGWRPVITDSSRTPTTPEDPYYNGGSQEASSAQASSFEPEQDEPAPQPQHQQQQGLYQEPLPPQQPQHQVQPMQIRQHQLPPPSRIPPQVSPTVKFPDSEEDHEDRHHHGRNRLRQPMLFDRSKYMTRPVPPPIVMRRHPHSTGPFPPNPLNNRQGPPQAPPPHQQRPMMAQASQPNPQYVEHAPPPPPPPPPSQPQVRPPISPMNRNFHMRHNPLRRFNFGGPPQAQPRSGGNIKWPTDDNVDPGRDNAGKRQNVETVQSEVSNNKRRRRRAVGMLIELSKLLFS